VIAMPIKPVRKTAGFTLAEVLIALAILALTTGAVIFLFFTGTRLDAAGYKLTIAQATAQLRMEELVGRTEPELADFLNDEYTPAAGVLTRNETGQNFNFRVTLALDLDYAVNGVSYPNLAHALIRVFDADDATELYRLENVLNVVSGGFLS
jgi:prepilin-type N-terminal cleavage/methylation domain-containing protein